MYAYTYIHILYVCMYSHIHMHTCTYMQILVTELPSLLSELREDDVVLGSLRTLPVSPSDVWKAALDEAMKRAIAQVWFFFLLCVP